MPIEVEKNFENVLKSRPRPPGEIRRPPCRRLHSADRRAPGPRQPGAQAAPVTALDGLAAPARWSSIAGEGPERSQLSAFQMCELTFVFICQIHPNSIQYDNLSGCYC